jgi:phenylpropionate dioxygenase-like ring-hydroxylating dioxygenase large terminal subunit
MEAAKNAYLTNVEPGTPMGRLLRSYWIPLLYSHELAECDGPPRRIRLLGESLLAFRDSEGRVGLLDHQCPHRRASLFYGRNEQGGLRCAYHGWKFDVEGRCLDIPNEPGDCPLLRKVRAVAYPCREANGIIWTFMGESTGKDLPPLPTMGWAAAPLERKSTLKYIRNCNWVQAMEGDLDSSHLGFLHSKLDAPEPGPKLTKVEGGDALRPICVIDRQPELQVVDTPLGLMCGASRGLAEEERYWRVTQFQLPFYTSVPSYGGLNRLKIWVPMDNEHTLIWEANWTNDRDLDAEERLGWKGRVGASGFLPETDDWYGRGNFTARAENDYLVDRERQKTHNFTGMEDETPVQDAAMQESMGAIVDRTREHLSASDAAIIRMRRHLFAAAEALEANGVVPPGVERPDLYLAHGEQMLVGPADDWKSVYAALMAERYRSLQPASSAA